MMIWISENLRAKGTLRPKTWSVYRTGAAPTLPCSHSLLLSLRLMCRSTLVSPLLMRMECHRVSPPSATATELRGGGGQTDLYTRLPAIFLLPVLNQSRTHPDLVSTQRKMTHL